MKGNTIRASRQNSSMLASRCPRVLECPSSTRPQSSAEGDQSSPLHKFFDLCFAGYIALLFSGGLRLLPKTRREIQQTPSMWLSRSRSCRPLSSNKRLRILYIEDDRADAAASMHLAWTQNMHRCAGAFCWRRVDVVYFASRGPGRKSAFLQPMYS